MLLGSSFAAIGLFISCLTTHPVVAAIASLAVILTMWIISFVTPDPENPVHLIALSSHFEGFLNGSIAIKDLIYFGLLIVTFLVLSIRRLDAERLRA